MEMSDKVLAALEVLKAAAENDFERHRIDVLISDLTDPPKVEIIDETHQIFNGVNFKKNNSNHFSKEIGLHRAIFSYYFGEIPEGYDIHHIDLNPFNNEVSNLQLLTKSEHQKLHHQLSKSQNVCKNCGKLFLASSKCVSPVFCSAYCRDKYEHENQKQIEKVCPICGKKFVPKYLRKICCSDSCSNKLKSLNHATHITPRVCPICGKIFTPKNSRNVCCSRDCGFRYESQNRKNRVKTPIERICPVCGKKFNVPFKSSRKKFCSISCASTNEWQQRKSTEESPILQPSVQPPHLDP